MNTGDTSSERVWRRDYRPPDFLIDQADLHFDLDELRTVVRSRLTVRRNPVQHSAAPLRLDGEGLDLISVSVDGERLSPTAFHVDTLGLTLLQPPDTFILETEVEIHPARNADLMGLYAAGGVLCTQCEPEAFRRITYFIDRPDVQACFRAALCADVEHYPVLLSNGNVVSHESCGDGRHQVVWEDPFPKPSYLFALVAGRLECVNEHIKTASGRSVDLRLFVEPRQSEGADHALASLKRAMAWDEKRYGREYDLDVFNAVAISQYTMGAMENKGLNIFNDRYVLANPASATDRDYRDIEALVAHEYFHNWSGNRVTCRDWFQLALKEGFTVFREQQYVADQGWEVRRIEDARLMRTRQFAEDAGPLAHAVRPESYLEIDNFYTDTVYSKGAEIVRMLWLLLGEEDFRRATDLYFTRHDGQATTLEDFLNCMSEVSGRELSQFARWYDEAGTPRLLISGEFHAAQGIYELRVEQKPPHDAPLHMPLALGLLDDNGRALPVQVDDHARIVQGTVVLDLRERTQRFRFSGLECEPVPALLRGFSAPVEVAFDYTPDDLLVLILHDPDNFVRWDAMQRLVAQCVREALEDSPGRAEQALARAIEAVLCDGGVAESIAALLLEFPDIITLSEALGAMDLDAVHEARQRLVERLARLLHDRFEAVYRRCRDGAPYRPQPADAGRRALCNACLGYLSVSLDADAMDLCLAQYKEADNMTDALAALALLAHGEGPQRDEALADFHRRWRHDPLIVDKWLSVQARSTRADTLERVRELMREPFFAMDQPNRVRSLVEVFCAENPAGFHRGDGSGYRFLADCVLSADSANPQLAAGLLRYLTNWRGCDRRRRRLMHAELVRVYEEPRLSPQTAEIAESALERI